MDKVKEVMQNRVSRRKFIAGVSAGLGATAAVSLAAGCGGSDHQTPIPTTTTTSPTVAVTDSDILNFALNLEYLEAEFYLRAVTGNGLATADIGANPGAVTGGAKVTFTTDAMGQAIQAYAVEIANHEQTHVQFLRAAITSLKGTPVDRPAIDFTNAFNAAATAATIGPTFDPFSDQFNFILGSFVFEDVGVTAYDGAAAAITDKTTVLAAAGSIVAVEAYHASLIRTLIVGADTANGNTTYQDLANKISDLRGMASSATGGVAAETHVSSSTIVAADKNSLAYARTTDQVLHIVYLNATAGPVSKGGFFPNGVNGTIAASTT